MDFDTSPLVARLSINGSESTVSTNWKMDYDKMGSHLSYRTHDRKWMENKNNSWKASLREDSMKSLYMCTVYANVLFLIANIRTKCDESLLHVFCFLINSTRTLTTVVVSIATIRIMGKFDSIITII